MFSASMPIEHVDPQELALFIHEKLPRIRAESIRAHVRLCTECEELLVSGLLSRISAINTVQAVGQQVEHRSSTRLARTGAGYVQSICPLSFDRIATEIIDTSEDGLGLITSASLAVGALLQVCVGDLMLLGEVRSCRESENGRFRLGVHIQPHAANRAPTARI